MFLCFGEEPGVDRAVENTAFGVDDVALEVGGGQGLHGEVRMQLGAVDEFASPVDVIEGDGKGRRRFADGAAHAIEQISGDRLAHDNVYQRGGFGAVGVFVASHDQVHERISTLLAQIELQRTVAVLFGSKELLGFLVERRHECSTAERVEVAVELDTAVSMLAGSEVGLGGLFFGNLAVGIVGIDPRAAALGVVMKVVVAGPFDEQLLISQQGRMGAGIVGNFADHVDVLGEQQAIGPGFVEVAELVDPLTESTQAPHSCRISAGAIGHHLGDVVVVVLLLLVDCRTSSGDHRHCHQRIEL